MVVPQAVLVVCMGCSMNIVTHNLSAMNAQRQFGINEKKKTKSAEKLSSGYRINRSADDAAGLAISEKMRRQVRGLRQASANALDGISLVQTADGAMNEISDMLQRCNELAVKSANGTNTVEDRNYIQKEITQLATEIERITSNTTFNERPVLLGDGDGSTITIVTPQGNSLPSWVTMDSASAANGIMADTYTDSNGDNFVASKLDFSGLNASNVGDLDGAGFHFTCCTCDRYYSVEFDSSTTSSSVTTPENNCYIYTVGIQNLTTATDILQAVYNALGNGNPQSHYTQMEIDGDTAIFHDNRVGTQANKANGRGVFAQETIISSKTAATNFEVILQVGTDALEGTRIKIDLPDLKTLHTGSYDVTTPEKANQTINIIKSDLQHVSQERARMGSYQNRLEHTIANLDNVHENTSDAESRIRDTDMSKEMVNYSNIHILEQVGHAMITQANQSNQGVLSLLQ